MLSDWSLPPPSHCSGCLRAGASEMGLTGLRPEAVTNTANRSEVGVRGVKTRQHLEELASSRKILATSSNWDDPEA